MLDMMMMPMYFFFKPELMNFLFENFNIMGTKALVVLCIVTLIVVALFEGFKLIKVFFELKVKQDPLTYGQTDGSLADKIGLLSSLMIPVDMNQIKRKRLKYHFFGCVFHMLNLLFGYIIMLVFMTYSFWVGMAITLGVGVGYWVFGFLQQRMVEKYQNLNDLQLMTLKDQEREKECGAINSVMQSDKGHM